MLTIPGKIPIRIHPFFWVLAGIIGWLSSQSVLGTFLWVFIITYSVLIHEFGHALTALVFGQEAEISLVAMGGLTQRRGRELKFWQDFLVVFNGPLAGLLLFFIALQINTYLLSEQSSIVLRYIVQVTIYVNLFWSIVNLLPVQPLDGGRLLSICLEGFFGLTGLKIALFLSMLISVCVGVFFFVFSNVLIGAFFLLLTYESYQNWRRSLPLSSSDRNEELQQLLKDAEKDLKLGHRDDAWVKLSELRKVSEEGMIYVSATQYMAALLAAEQRYKEAYDLILPNQKNLDPEHLHLLHQLSFRNKDWETAINLGNRIYRSYPGYDTALINAYCYAMKREVDPSIGWLQCAIRDGLPNVNVVLHRSEFDSIRQDPRFQELFRKSSQD